VAIWNEILEGSLNQLISRRLGMQGGSPAPAVTPELGCGLVLENDRPEWSWLKGENLLSARGGAAAVAAQFGFCSISNPPNSGIICTVERIVWQSLASNMFVKMLPLGSETGTPVNPGVRDGRWRQGISTARGACNITAGTTPAASPETVLDYLHANANDSRGTAYILRPNQSLRVECEVANIVLANITFVWRERGANSGELA